MLLHHHGMQLVYFLVPLKPFSFSYLPFLQKFPVPSDKRESNNEIQLNFFFSDYNQRFLQPVDPWRPNCTRRCRSPSHGTRAAPGYVRAIALAPKMRGTAPKQQVLAPKKNALALFHWGRRTSKKSATVASHRTLRYVHGALNVDEKKTNCTVWLEIARRTF